MPNGLSLLFNRAFVKQLPLALSALALALCGVLFYLVLSKPAGPAVAATAPTDSTGAPTPTGQIVYINTDSLFAKYQFAIDTQKELEQRANRLRADLGNREQRLQQQVQEAQQAARTMTQQQMQQTERTLMQAQQQYVAYRESQSDQLQKLERDRQKELLQNIQTGLKELNADGRYTYVLGFTQSGGGILLAPDASDVTTEVVTHLNEKYAATKAAEKK